MRRGWADFASDYPATLYAPEDLMPYAAEIAREIDVIVYYALFLALAEHSGALMVTADMKPLSVLESMPYIRLTLPLTDVSSLGPHTGREPSVITATVLQPG